MNWQIVYGSQESVPEIDSTSSKFYVYLRRNVGRVTTDDGELWRYEECKLTRDEFAQMKIAALEDENTQLQLAIVDLYESLLEG